MSAVELAVVSDTHIPDRADALPETFRERIGRADHVVHAGDFETPAVLRDVSDLATELTAVYGNADPPSVGLPPVDAVELGGVWFVVTHGTRNRVEAAVHPTDAMVMTESDWLAAIADTARVRSRAWAHDDPVVGIGGHTHEVVDRVHEGVRLLNPGSATGADPADEATMLTVDVAAGDLEVSCHVA